MRRPALDAMRESERRYREQDAKRLCYLSMEFLMGRALGNNLTNLGLYDDTKAIMSEMGADLEELPDGLVLGGNEIEGVLVRALRIHELSAEPRRPLKKPRRLRNRVRHQPKQRFRLLNQLLLRLRNQTRRVSEESWLIGF